MASSEERDDPAGEEGSAAAHGTGGALDRALELYAVHAAAVERYRLAVIAFQVAKAEFEAQQAARDQVRAARQHAARHREFVHSAVTGFVTHLRDIGTPPERMLVTLRDRVTLVSRTTTNRIPSLEMQVLLTDVSLWAIKAYYEAA